MRVLFPAMKPASPVATVQRAGGAAEPADVAPRDSRPIGLIVATVFAATAAAIWIGAVIMTAGHGFDTSDEGYYLLSYRWWDTNLRTFTGIQYIYGPVFEALGHNIAGLRLFRLFTVVGTHVVFGWNFMRWLRLRRPAAPPTRMWEVAGTAAILAAGGLVYGWLPLSPGYNDVSLLGSMLLTAIVLRVATAAATDRPAPAWVAFCLGPIVVAMVMAKWASAIVTFGLVGIALVVVYGLREWRQLLRFAAWALAGMLLTVLAIQFFLVPLNRAVPEMLAVNRLAAHSSNGPSLLLRLYWDTSVDLLSRTLRAHWLVLVAAVVGLLARRALMQWIAGGLAMAGLAVSAWEIIRRGGLGGGTVHLTVYPSDVLIVVLMVMVIGAGATIARRTQRQPGLGEAGMVRRSWVVYALLFLLPVTQAMGTGNPIYMMAVNAFGACMALMIAVVTGAASASQVSRALALAAVAGGVAIAATIGANGVILNPYRTEPYSKTTDVAGVPALSSVRMDPQTAQEFSLFYARLKPYVEPPGRAVMAFDEMAGYVLLLDGRSVGEAWYSDLDRERTRRGIIAECARDKAWWGGRSPILIFRREVSEGDVNALESCGLVFATDYRLLAPKENTMGLSVYVPATEYAKG